MNEYAVLAAVVAFGLLTIAWIFSVKMERADIIDPCWGLGFALIALTVTMKSGQIRFVPSILMVIWGARLTLHLGIRWRSEQHEDRRYAAMRSAGGPRWWLRSLVTVFWLQAAIMWFLSVPLTQAIAAHEILIGRFPDAQPRNLMWIIIGIVVWFAGLFFETVADWQLTRFRSRSDSAHQVLNTGLWKYTRHPNYFGDFLVWWGLFCVCVAYGASWTTAYAPMVMSILLMKFSGVGLLEKNISQRRPAYRTYCETTPAFFPWFPKNQPSEKAASTA